MLVVAKKNRRNFNLINKPMLTYYYIYGLYLEILFTAT